MINRKIIEYYSKLESGHLFPLDGKIPALKGDWRKRKFTVNQLLDFVSRGFNLGWAIGSDHIVIDIDPRNGGDKSLKKILTRYSLPDLSTLYPTVITGGGGYHYYCGTSNRINATDIKSKQKKYPGIDIKKSGGYVVIAGSVHPDTQDPYIFDTSSPYKRRIKPMHKVLVKIFKSSIKSAIEGSGKIISVKALKRLLKKLPIEDYNTNDLWFPILAASHNATKGRGLEVFLDWSMQDPKYSNDKNLITARWQSFKNIKSRNITVQTLLREVLKYDSLQRISSLREVKKEFGDEVTGKGKKKKKIKSVIPEQMANDIPYIIAKSVLDKKFQGGETILHGQDLRYWVYNGRYWSPIQINIIERYLYEESLEYKLKNPHLNRSVNTIFKASEMILRAMCASDMDLFKFYFDQSIINTNNKELWLDDNTGKIEVKDHNPSSSLTYCLDTEYDKKADCPRFKQALKEIFENQPDTNDIIRHLMELIGYTIQAKKNIATWVLFHGKGSNGKTVILQVISALLGESALEKSIDELNPGRNNHALASLPGKLAIIDEDVNAFTTLPDGMIKKVSENKHLTANPKGAHEFRFKNCAIPLLAANNWPVTKDLSEGLRRRALVFHFTRQFSPQESDIGLADYIICNELDGVLNMALEGLQRLRARGFFKVPDSCRSAKDRWFLSNSQIHQFLGECFKPHANKKVLFNNVWNRYNVWCQDNGIKMSMAKHRLKNVLADIGIKVEYTKSKRLYLIGYQQEKVKV